jgi:hypothetical protein
VRPAPRLSRHEGYVSRYEPGDPNRGAASNRRAIPSTSRSNASEFAWGRPLNPLTFLMSWSAASLICSSEPCPSDRRRFLTLRHRTQDTGPRPRRRPNAERDRSRTMAAMTRCGPRHTPKGDRCCNAFAFDRIGVAVSDIDVVSREGQERGVRLRFASSSAAIAGVPSF